MFSANTSQVAAGAGVNYIEDVFSTWLYTGNGSTQTIPNGIDLSTKGGLVWIKQRNATVEHFLYDTARGVTKSLSSNDTTSEYTNVDTLTAFGTSGFTLGSSNFVNGTTSAPRNYASWTFREQPKFFDVVTYSGNSTNRTIAHNLGSVPGCIIVKDLLGGSWNVYHRSLANTQALVLNTTDAVGSAPTYWNSTTATSTEFSLGTSSQVNFSGHDYVAYIFAHDAGGFGLTGTDNVISCGSFSTATSGKMSAAVNLGYEPQWLLVKNYGASENWVIYDNMRGMSNTGYAALNPNSSGAEYTGTSAIAPTATGFDTPKSSGPFADFSNYIYIAIRRGPMKVPTDATSVLDVETWSGNSSGNRNISVGFPADLNFFHVRNDVNGWNATDRLRGNGQSLQFDNTGAEFNINPDFPLFNSFQNELKVTGTGAAYINETGYNQVFFSLRRAPSFFDEVCYTGTGSATTQTHNLGVVPEMMIVKWRTGATGSNWSCYHSALGNTQVISLNEDSQAYTASQWNNTTPTSTVFSVGTQNNVNGSAKTYVAYLFATCAGVSKVGSYTGTGSNITVDCGFTGGARFVMVKRTDSTGSWVVLDTARGMVAGSDYYLYLNSTDAENNANILYTVATGFQVQASAGGALNASGGSYIFLAIA